MSGEDAKSTGNLYDNPIRAHSEIDIVKIQSVQVESMEEIKELFLPVTSAMNRFRPRLGLFQKETDGEFDDLPDDDSESGSEAKFPSFQLKRKTLSAGYADAIAILREEKPESADSGQDTGNPVSLLAQKQTKSHREKGFQETASSHVLLLYADLEEVSQAITEYFWAKCSKKLRLGMGIIDRTVPNDDGLQPCIR
eukprot:764908-Hanusia_phi.AAC.2